MPSHAGRFKSTEGGFLRVHKRGFTLSEIVITVAIIGAISAISVPNFMRLKMGVNMEMVKQHLRVIGENLNELLNRDHQFPSNLDLPGNSEVEVSLTANLSSIETKGYTADDYLLTPELNGFQLRSCPEINTAGDMCFILDAMSITTIPRWRGDGLAMIGNQWFAEGPQEGDLIGQIMFPQESGFSSYCKEDGYCQPLTEGQKFQMFLNTLELWAYQNANQDGDVLKAAVIQKIPDVSAERYEQYFSDAAKILESKGINLFVKDGTDPRRAAAYQVGISLNGPPPYTPQELQSRTPPVGTTALSYYENYWTVGDDLAGL